MQIVSTMRRLEARNISLDSKAFDDSVTSLVDTLVSPGIDQEQTVAGTEVQARMRAAVREAVETLDKRERYIVKHHLMADSEDELSLAEIGRRLGVSRERARQLEAHTKRKLRSRISDITGPDGGEWLDDIAIAAA